MRILRWVLIAAAALLVLLGGAAAILYATFDPNDHRDNIVRLVAEKTGRTLRLDAPMSLSFFPWLGVKLGEVTLENPPGFGEEPFATVKELAVRVEVLPLLDGHLVVDTLEVDGLELALHRREDGRDNWSGLAETSSTERGPGTEPVAAEGWLKDYAVRGVELTNGAVSWRDERAGSHYRVNELNLAMGSIAPGSTVPLEGALRLEGLAEGVAAELRLSGSLSVSEDLARAQMPDLHLEMVSHGPAFPSTGLSGELSAGFAYTAGELALDNLSLKLPGGVELAGQIRGKLTEPLDLQGRFAIKPFRMREALAALQIEAPVTRDPGVLGTASGSFDLKATTERLALVPVSIQFDDTRVDGKVDVGLVSPQRVDFGFEIDSLDLDRYLPPTEGEATGRVESAGGQTADPAGIGGLAALTTRGTVSIGTLKVGGVRLSNTRVGISSGNGAIKLDPMSAGLYGGEYRGSLALKSAGPDVQWHATEQVQGVQIGPLLRDLAGEDRISGTGRIDSDLKGRGLSDAAVRRSAQGNLSFDFRDGALKGVNLAQVMRELEARLKGQRVEQTGPLQTDFSSLTGTLNVGGGTVRNDDLVMKSPFIRVTGKGNASLIGETIDYLMTVKIVGSTTGQGGREFADIEGIPVGVRVTGTFSEPSFKPDFQAALKAVAKQQLKGEQEKLEEKAKGELEKALKRLF